MLLIFHLSIIVDRVGWLSLTLAIFDAHIFGYFVWSAIRFGIASSLAGGALSFVICLHLRELNSSLGLALTHQAMLESIGNHCSGALQRQLASFRLEHHYLLRLSQHVNVHLVSRLLLALLLTNVLYNIVTLSVLLRANVDQGEQIFLLLMIAVEGLLPLVTCSIFAAWSSAFYTCDRLLYRAQACLVRSDNALTYPKILLAKLQLLPFYEFICTEKPFRFTVGQVGTISKRALFEVSLTFGV